MSKKFIALASLLVMCGFMAGCHKNSCCPKPKHETKAVAHKGKNNKRDKGRYKFYSREERREQVKK